MRSCAQITVNCAPLLDVCRSCGQRDAIVLTARSPFSEVLDFNNPAKMPDALTLVYGNLLVTAFLRLVSNNYRFPDKKAQNYTNELLAFHQK
jgi:hypothetical protein